VKKPEATRDLRISKDKSAGVNEANAFARCQVLEKDGLKKL
jgi:hypothetical protein